VIPCSEVVLPLHMHFAALSAFHAAQKVFLRGSRLTHPTHDGGDMKKQYRTFLIYPDGTLHVGQVFYSLERMNSAMRAMARKPGVRYYCEEWTVSAIAGEDSELMTEKIAEYEL
jgi:hypothetical protein